MLKLKRPVLKLIERQHKIHLLDNIITWGMMVMVGIDTGVVWEGREQVINIFMSSTITTDKYFMQGYINN